MSGAWIARAAMVLAVGLASVSAQAQLQIQTQASPQLQVQTDADTVGVGDVLRVELVAQSADGAPSDPQPGPTPGFVVRGQSASPSQTRISINGQRMDHFGLTVDWSMQAQKVGTFSLGPPSVSIGGVRYAAHPVRIRVVPAGQAPPRARAAPQTPQGFGFSPFDPWRGLFPGMDRDPDDLAPPQPTITVDPKLSLDAPRGALYFLHATVDPPAAVVGQQVTFSVYEYVDQSDGSPLEVDGADVHDPTAADFVKRSLMRDDQEAVLAGFASVGGHVWKVSLVRRWALFPLRAGDLEIGPMSVGLVRPRSMAGQKRSTEALRVHVTEPPAAGRPPGYALGDVGHLALSAQVTPRDIDQGAAVGVHVELSGTGNIPASLALPTRPGVEWLAPETHEQLGASGRDTFGGKRTFDYVVRLQTSGDVDLGELALPFFDPTTGRYDVARAPLGIVHVKPTSTSASAPSAAAADLPLAGLPGARQALEGSDAAHAHLDDRPLFWIFGVGAWPLAFGLAVGGRAAGRRVAGAWRTRRASPLTELKERILAAEAACRGTDARASDAAIAKVLEAAAVAHAGVSVRGAIGPEVAERLERAGTSREVASEVADVLRACEAARFSPEEADVAHARERWARARAAIRHMERT